MLLLLFGPRIRLWHLQTSLSLCRIEPLSHPSLSPNILEPEYRLKITFSLSTHMSRTHFTYHRFVFGDAFLVLLDVVSSSHRTQHPDYKKRSVMSHLLHAVSLLLHDDMPQRVSQRVIFAPKLV